MTAWIIGIVLLVIGGIVVWALIEKSQKEKAIRTRDLAIENSMAIEKKLTKVKDNIDSVLDYNNKNVDTKTKIDQHVEILKHSKKDKEVINELEKIRADVHDVLTTL